MASTNEDQETQGARLVVGVDGDQETQRLGLVSQVQTRRAHRHCSSSGPDQESSAAGGLSSGEPTGWQPRFRRRPGEPTDWQTGFQRRQGELSSGTPKDNQLFILLSICLVCFNALKTKKTETTLFWRVILAPLF